MNKKQTQKLNKKSLKTLTLFVVGVVGINFIISRIFPQFSTPFVDDTSVDAWGENTDYAIDDSVGVPQNTANNIIAVLDNDYSDNCGSSSYSSYYSTTYFYTSSCTDPRNGNDYDYAPLFVQAVNSSSVFSSTDYFSYSATTENFTTANGGTVTVTHRPVSANNPYSTNSNFHDLYSQVTYTPAFGFSGIDSFTYLLCAANPYANGDTQRLECDDLGDPTDKADRTATVTINVFNQGGPSVADVNKTALEDNSMNFSPNDFTNTYSGNNGLSDIVIDTLPQNGDLFEGGVPVTPGSLISVFAIPTLVYVPLPNFNGPDSFQWTGFDGQAGPTNSADVLIEVEEDDDTPTVTDFSIETPFNTPYSFDTSPNPTLFDQNYSDVDLITQGGPNEAWLIDTLVINQIPANGELQANLGRGTQTLTNGEIVPSISIPTLEYIPDDGYFGSDSFEWFVTESFGGIVGPISLEPVKTLGTSNVATTNITVQNQANQPPNILDARISAGEDLDYTFADHDFSEETVFGTGSDNEGYVDPEDVTYTRVRIESLPTIGELHYNSTLVENTDLPLEIDRVNVSNLLYRPPLNYNNNNALPLPSFDFNVRDDIQYGTTSGQMEIGVIAVNDAPAVDNFTVEFDQDTNWYFNMPDDANNNCFSARFTDVDINTQQFQEAWELGGLRLMSNPQHGRLFVYPDGTSGSPYSGQAYEWTQGLVIARDDIESMVFIPDAGFSGQDTFDWQATDELITVSGAGGGITYEWSNTATTTLNILEVNQPPVVSDVNVTAIEDTLYQFEDTDFTNSFSDPDTGDQLGEIMIESLPTNGTLLLYDAEAFVGDTVDVFWINPDPIHQLGGLQYVPDPDFCGVDSFDYNGRDDDGTDPQYAVNVATVNITINCVNDAPTVVDVPINVFEDADYIFDVNDFENGYSDPESTPLERVQITSLPAQGELLYNNNPVSVNDEILRGDIDDLVYRPNPNQNGSDSFSWNGSDGQDYADSPALINITIAGINDAPSVTNFNFSTPFETDYLFNSVSPNLFIQNYSDVDENTQAPDEGWLLTSIRIESVPTKGDLVLNSQVLTAGDSVQAVDIDDVMYRPFDREFGGDSFTWSANDGYIDIASAQLSQDIQLFAQSNIATTNITIGNPSDLPPISEDFSVVTEFNQPYTFTLQDFIDNYSDPENDSLESVFVETLPATGELYLNNVPVIIGQQIVATSIPDLEFRPETNYVGTTTFDYSVQTNDLRSNVSTISTVVNDFIDLTIVVTKDTPDEQIEIDKQVCIDAVVTNPNLYRLNDIVVNLSTNEIDAPFVVGSFVIPNTVTPSDITDTTSQFLATLDGLDGGESVTLRNCVLPKTTDLSVVDATTYLENTTRFVQDDVEIDPEVDMPELVRTGANNIHLGYIALMQGFALGVISWFAKKLKNSKK